jgi:hypothetical protein
MGAYNDGAIFNQDKPPVANSVEVEKRVGNRCKTFEELAVRIGKEPGGDACLFARWLDQHGYKTFPDMPDYIE